jgi:XTP/dITP diphosphohydrolase
MSFLSLLVATENSNKLKEMSEIFGEGTTLLSLKDLKRPIQLPEEGVESYEKNSQQKAIYVGEEMKVLTLADDSGFEVAALGGAPGVLSARFAGSHDPAFQRRQILERLLGVEDRSCKFVCVLSLYDPHRKKVDSFRGEVSGRVSYEERGSFGFGYDSIMIPEGYSETFGELSSEIKNKISHRAHAISALKRQLKISL